MGSGDALLGFTGLNLAISAQELVNRYGKPLQATEASAAFGQKYKVFWYQSTDEFGSKSYMKLTFILAASNPTPSPSLDLYRVINVEFVRLSSVEHSNQLPRKGSMTRQPGTYAVITTSEGLIVCRLFEKETANDRTFGSGDDGISSRLTSHGVLSTQFNSKSFF